mmetsp:Transcript_6521/g.7306  ORF Transcript_6521/g.7306 Transcript_6521/m.7306 type:complete len:439 (+) Transcript_6521:32-1348(+)
MVVTGQKQKQTIAVSLVNKTALAKRCLLGVNFFVETNRLEAFVAVYFIVMKGWSEYRIGIISIVMNFAGIISQIPAGDFLDKTSYKKTTTIFAILVAAVTTACVGWTSNFWVVLTAKATEGIAAATFMPALMSLLFGICLTAEEIPNYVGKTEVWNKVGSVLFTLGCGLIAYILYPNIESIFYLLGAGGIMAALFVALIPSSAIDSNRARQLNKKEAVGEDDENPIKPFKDSGLNPKIMPLHALLGDKQVLAFAASTFLYHLANAGITPLISQYIAIGNNRTSMVFVSAALLIFYLFQGITAQLMRTVIEKVSTKTLLIYAHIFLIVRCTMILSMIQWWDNKKYALTATQALEGIAAGIYDTMLPIAAGQLIHDSGRFGLTYSIMLTTWRIGHGVSVFLGEYIVHAVSYQVAFLAHGGLVIISLMWLIAFVRFAHSLV